MVSALEQKEAPDADTLERIAALLKVPAEAISNFNEEAVTTIISTVVNNSDTSTGNSLFCYSPTINPHEKWLGALEEKKACTKPEG